MPKTAKHLWPIMTSYNTLYASYERVSKTKRYSVERYNFEIDIDENIIRLQEELRAHTYKPLPVRDKTIYEPKERLISIPAFRDRVAQGAFNLTVRPYLERKLIDHTYACRPNKGLQPALTDIQRMLPHWSHIIHIDFSGYFDSIDHNVLKYLWSRVISDPDMLWFLAVNVDSYPGPCGMHKGNVMNQDNGNLALSAGDHYLCEQMKLGRNAYRFMDDLLIGCTSRSQAMDILYAYDNFCSNRLHLRLNARKTHIERYDDRKGVTFCKRTIHKDFIEMAHKRLCQTERKIRMFKREGREIDLYNAYCGFMGEMKHLTWTPHALKVKRLFEELMRA